jgi:hypothetical protein
MSHVYLVWRYDTRCDARNIRSLQGVYRDRKSANIARERMADNEEWAGISYGVETEILRTAGENQ